MIIRRLGDLCKVNKHQTIGASLIPAFRIDKFFSTLAQFRYLQVEAVCHKMMLTSFHFEEIADDGKG